MKSTVNARLSLIAAMVIFGTIGPIVRLIPLSSALIALTRGVVGTAFLLLVGLCARRTPDRTALRSQWGKLLFSGACIGFNWILLFEAYVHCSSLATATLCYYMAPIFVVLFSPLVSGERLTVRRILCVAAALLGMVGVSGVLGGEPPSGDDLLGIACGLGAAALYAAAVLTNKKITKISPSDRTTAQLGVAAVCLLPYTLLTGGFLPTGEITLLGIGALLLVSVLHTGVAYSLFFGAMGVLSSQSTAILSYIDPAVAIFLSALLGEPLTVYSIVGAVLILGAAIVSELPSRSSR